MLSGPEPQRTYLEIKLLKEIREYIRKHPNIDILFVKGKVGKQEKAFDGNVEIHGYLTSKELNEKMAACNLIITRSGYSTIMDLVTINKKAILIPTPSQTEYSCIFIRKVYLLNKFTDNIYKKMGAV